MPLTRVDLIRYCTMPIFRLHHTLYFTCLYGYKVLNHLSPQYISNLFASYESRFPKRDQKLLLIPLDSLNHAVSTKFNNLPFLLRATDKLRTFKTNLLKHIFQTI